jgi:hypothetical protein
LLRPWQRDLAGFLRKKSYGKAQNLTEFRGQMISYQENLVKNPASTSKQVFTEAKSQQNSILA